MIGSIVPFAGSALPNGYLLCDGSSVSRTDYAELFSVIGTKFGSGDGSTTFNVPNLNGRLAIGQSNDHLFASSGGEETHALTIGEIASHLHSVPAHGHSNDIAFKTPELSHSITAQPSFTYTRANSTATNGVRQTGASYTGRKNASMSRATSVAISDHPATDCTMSGGVTDCPAFDTETTGNGDAHNNMMPYIALVFLIQAEPDTPPGPVIPSMVLFNGALPVGPSGAYISGRK